jgi:gluconolactonase
VRTLRPNVSVMAEDLGFTEGPVILQRGGVIVTSVSTGRLFRVDPDGSIHEIVVGNAPNGLAEGADGRIFIAQCGATSPIGAGGDLGREGGVQVLDPDGSVSWLTTEPTSPNDICIGPDGWIYCTDPTRPMGSQSGRIWRVHADSGEAQKLVDVDWYPNGLGFGLNDDELFVAHTQEAQIVRYPLAAGALGPGEVAFTMTDGHPDGFAFDTDGNLVVCAVQFSDRPGTIQRWTPDGELLDVVTVGTAKVYANVAVDPEGTMYVTGSSEGTVLRVDGVGWRGLPLHPFR